MKIKLLNTGGYMTIDGAVGAILEATHCGDGAEVTSLELREAGASEAFGMEYPFLPDEFEVIEDDN